MARKRSVSLVGSVAALVAAALLLTGCSGTESAPMSASDKANFGGGTPPPDAQAKMQEWMARSKNRPAGGAGGTGGTNAAPAAR